MIHHGLGVVASRPYAEGVDRASARLLRHLARHLPERVLLLVCFRDPPGSRHPPLRELLADLEARGLADRLALTPLSERDLAALVTAWTGRPAPAPFLQALWSSTGGNPFYAGEVVGDLANRGRFDRADAWRVPTGLRDVLRERLRTLSATTREVVAGAAVVGHEVDLALLPSIVDEAEDSVVGALDEAVQAGWLVEAEGAWDVRYAFRHAVMREAVYADLPALRRQRLHARAADAIESAGRAHADAAAAALHLRAAGRFVDRHRAAEASLRAADEAARVFAWDEAVAHAEAAAAMLADAGAPPARQAEAAMCAARPLERFSADYPRAVAHLEAALAHARAAGDEAAVASVRSLLGVVLSSHHSVMDIPRALDCFAAAEQRMSGEQAAFELHLDRAQAALFGSRTGLGCDAAEEARALAERLGREDLLALARSMGACHRFALGELAGASALVDQTWATARARDDPHLTWNSVFLAAWIHNVYLLDPAASEAWCRLGLAQSRFTTIVHAREGVSDHLAYALASQGRLDAAREVARELPADALTRRLLLLLDGRWEDAERSWDDAFARDSACGNLLNAALNACWLGEVRALLGRETEAIAVLRRALALSLDGPHVPTELLARADLARLLAAAGETEEAVEHLSRCDEILALGNWRGQAGSVELARAATAAAQGHLDRADRAHAAALDVFTTFRLPWKRAATLLAWARTLAASDRSGDVERRRAAREAYGGSAPMNAGASGMTAARRNRAALARACAQVSQATWERRARASGSAWTPRSPSPWARRAR